MKWEAGQPLAPMQKPPITRDQLKQYADASKDFNEIHTNEEVAKAHGLPSVIAHGMLSMGFMGDLISRNFPPAEYRVARFKAKFRKVTYPGDVVTCEGEVKRMDDEERVIVAVRVKNQNGEVTTDGEATLIPR